MLTPKRSKLIRIAVVYAIPTLIVAALAIVISDWIGVLLGLWLEAL